MRGRHYQVKNWNSKIMEYRMTAQLFDFPPQDTVIPMKPKNKPIKQGYTGEFLAFWGLYPPRFNSSKFLAFKAWSKLDDEERRQAMIAAPIYANSMRDEPEKYTQHAASWLNGKYFETIAVPQVRGAPPKAPVNWAAAVQIFNATGRWNADLGPAPDQQGYRGG